MGKLLWLMITLTLCTFVAAAPPQWDDTSPENNTSATVNSDRLRVVRNISSYPGTDLGEQINACIRDLPSTGGTCDGSAVEGAQFGSETVVLDKPVRLLLGAMTYTTSAPGGGFICTTPGSSIIGSGIDSTFVVTSSTTADLIRVDCTFMTVSDMTLQSSVSRIDGAGINILVGDSIFERLRIERTYYGILIGKPGAGANQFSNIHFATGTSSGGNWRAAIWVGAGTIYWPFNIDSPTIASNHFNNVMVTGDSPFSDAAVHIDGGVDTLLFSNLEICNGACVGRADSIGIKFDNTASGSPAPDNPRWVYCTNCLVEAGTTQTGIRVNAGHDISFKNSYVGSSRIGVHIAAAGVHNFQFDCCEIVQIQEQAWLVEGGSGTILRNTHVANAGVAVNNAYIAVSYAPGINNFRVVDNDFSSWAAPRNKPAYFVTVASGTSDYYEIRGNYFPAGDRGTGDVSDLGSGKNKLMGPNLLAP